MEQCHQNAVFDEESDSAVDFLNLPYKESGLLRTWVIEVEKNIRTCKTAMRFRELSPLN